MNKNQIFREIYNTYGLHSKGRQLIEVVGDNENEVNSTYKLSLKLGSIKSQSLGPRLKNMESKGLVYNKSAHGGRFDWHLTEEGQQVYGAIKNA